MKIAQVAPLIESVPPRPYGGTERIVSYLTEELVRLAHDVTLFASADSTTSAEMAPTITNVAREFERAGLIERGRRQVTILDRQGLTEMSCECYRLVRARLAFHLPKTYA
jgi:hypothetical protein